MWGIDRKICPSRSQSGITWQASWCQTVILGLNFSICPSPNDKSLYYFIMYVLCQNVVLFSSIMDSKDSEAKTQLAAYYLLLVCFTIMLPTWKKLEGQMAFRSFIFSSICLFIHLYITLFLSVRYLDNYFSQRLKHWGWGVDNLINFENIRYILWELYPFSTLAFCRDKI